MRLLPRNSAFRGLRFDTLSAPASRPATVSSFKFLQVQKRNVSPRHKGPNGSRPGTVVSRTASPVSAGEIDFFDTIFGNSTVLQTWLQPVSALPPMGVPHCPDSTVSPTYTKHIEPRGISRSGFKLQGPTTRRSTSPGTLGPARGGTDPSVHGQPTVPTSLREDASLYRRDTRFAKGPKGGVSLRSVCRPQDETLVRFARPGSPGPGTARRALVRANKSTGRQG